MHPRSIKQHLQIGPNPRRSKDLVEDKTSKEPLLPLHRTPLSDKAQKQGPVTDKEPTSVDSLFAGPPKGKATASHRREASQPFRRPFLVLGITGRGIAAHGCGVPARWKMAGLLDRNRACSASFGQLHLARFYRVAS
jgi:hypothetical protein